MGSDLGRAGAGTHDLADLLGQLRILPRVLELDVEPDPATGEIDRLLECGDALFAECRLEPAPDVDLREFLVTDLVETSWNGRHPHQIRVVEEHDHPVGGGLHVDLGEVGPLGDRLSQRAQRVLGGPPLAPPVSGDLDRSIKFYTEVLGMTLLRQKDYPDGKFTLAFVGYGAEAEHSVIELTHNWDTPRYDLGNGFGHIALEVDDVYKATDEIRRRGGKIIRDAGPMNAGTTIIAFVEDPDGYQIELIGKKH